MLIKTLLNNYDNLGVVGRPVSNTSETIDVSYGIGLIQILDLDEKNQILTTNVWCRYVSTFFFLLSVQPSGGFGLKNVKGPGPQLSSFINKRQHYRTVNNSKIMETNRKSYIVYRMASFSMILDGP